MRSPLLALGVLVTVASLPIRSGAQAGTRQGTLSRAALEDKIRGGWAGQMIGVSFGAPTEFRYLGRTIDGDLPWSPERIKNSIQQDDLYVEMTFAEVMDRLGLDATTEQYGEAFRDTGYHLWHANAGARRALNKGIKAPMSGHPRYNAHANDIDFQIEADFIGLMTPGLPRESNRFCERVGRVMNYGDGLYGGMFVCGMYAAGYFESDPRKVVEAGLACIPARSEYGRLIRDVIDWSAMYPDDWKRTWQAVQDKWDRDDPCPGGALQPFNIDAKLNGAYIAMGLLYGGGDFGKTLEISTRCGQDSDCNPSNAVGILGVMLGYEKIPDVWRSGIPAISDQKFSYTNYSFKDIVRSTMDRALKLVERTGGKVTGDEITVKLQTPSAPELEQWDMGRPEKLVAGTEPAWSWKGDWTPTKGRVDASQLEGRITDIPGAEAELQFTGSAVMVLGNLGQDRGLADVYLDGKKVGEIDAYIPERTHDNALWHTYGLEDGPHTLRIVVRPQSDARSKGRRMEVLGAITFRPRKQ